MLKRWRCPACDSLPATTASAVLSPWVRELTGSRRRSSSIAQCRDCGSAWCEWAYDDREMSALYADYRGEGYLRTRSRWESWYSEHWNSAASDDAGIATRRRESLERFLTAAVDPSAIESVLDVGGDRGQFIPLGSRKMVLDVSGRQLVSGVQRVSSSEEIPTLDLIISAHLLEHVSDPVSEVKSYARAKYVYLEVPSGVPSLGAFRSVLSRCALIAAYSPQAWRLVTAPASGRSGTTRRQVLRQSEHINFFTMAGVAELLSASGRSILALETDLMPTPDGIDAAVIRVLAQ